MVPRGQVVSAQVAGVALLVVACAYLLLALVTR